MSDVEHTLDETPSPPPARPRPKSYTWLIVTGVLILLNLVTLGVMKYNDGKHTRVMTKQKAEFESKMQASETAYQENTRKLIKQQGESIANSFRMVNPLLLTDRGQSKALSFFSKLRQPNLRFLALYDKNGTMCVSSDMFLGDVRIPSGLTEVVSKAGQNGADVQFYGPITDSSDQIIGTVLVGMTFAADESVKPAAKPSAAAPENAEPVPTTTAPAPTTSAPAPTVPAPAPAQPQ